MVPGTEMQLLLPLRLQFLTLEPVKDLRMPLRPPRAVAGQQDATNLDHR